MKLFATLAIVLSTLLVLAWPLVFFFSIFLFDAPLHGKAEMERWVLAWSIWTYPWGYVVAIGYTIAIRFMRKGVPWWTSPTGILFLLPFAHLITVILVTSVLSW